MSEKDKHLKAKAGDFEAEIVISDKNKETIAWWIDNVELFPRSINISKPLLVIKTDSSITGWGVFIEINGDFYQGEWLDEDKEKHINYLELKVGFIALTKCCGDIRNAHVRLYMDNSVAVTYISKMGARLRRSTT